LHLHEHEDHLHVHEHFHGDHDNIVVSLMGFIIHSMADGCALGASLFLSTQLEGSSLGIVIFFAVLMHKIPTAIGFGTFLVHEGLSALSTFSYLTAFTIVSPLTATLSYIIFSLASLSSLSTFSTEVMFWVGILLLVSAGSFLYVATIHILPEVFCNTDIHRPHTHHHLPEDHVHDDDHFAKPFEIVAILAGFALPVLLLTLVNHA